MKKPKFLDALMFGVAFSTTIYIVTAIKSGFLDTEIQVQRQIEKRYNETIGEPSSPEELEYRDYIIYGVKPDTITIK